MSTAKAYTNSDGVELLFFRSPFREARDSPELFFAELIVYLTFVIGFIHAKKNGGEHLLFLFIAFAAASFVDPFCLISENIRNYFHSHASILMWDRHVAPWQFPLFGCIAYVPGAIVWSLNLDIIPETLLMAFVSSWTFYCFDLFACRWLLYQWHVSDPLYTARTECVPLASSMWVMTYAITASFLARISYRYLFPKEKPEPFGTEWWAAFAICTVVFLPLHILPITFFYFPSFILHLNLEYYCVWGFGLAGLLLSLISAYKWPNSAQTITTYPSLVIFQSGVWFGGLLFVLLYLDPQNVLSTSVHQPYGGITSKSSELCLKSETYLFGLSERKRYVCDEDLVHWRIAKDPATGMLPKPLDEWYTIQGLPMTREFFMHYLASLLVGIFIHLILFSLATRETKKLETVHYNKIE